MELIYILIFSLLALPYAALPGRARGWTLFIASAIALYALQPTLDIRWLDFSLPTIMLVITVICWWLTRSSGAVDEHPQTSQAAPPQRRLNENLIALFILIAVVLILTIPRYIDFPSALELTSRPPPIELVIIGIALALLVGGGFGRVPVRLSLPVMLLVIIGALIVLKTEPLTTALAGVLRTQVGLQSSLAKAADIGWLGFSYVAFRLIHTLRDRQLGILPALTLRDYVTYVIFFPALASGPIDRADRFAPDLHSVETMRGADAQRFMDGVTRIVIGMVKKFVIADSLAVFTLSAVTVEQAQHSGALWLLLYGYAFRLFFDFSGYTDIAIGIGLLFGIRLPENFDRPYAKSNITAFWNSWHMTLSAWVRTYVYSPLSRRLIKGKRLSNNMIILICNIVTMSVIGLWHGVTLTFFIWGLWHAIGLWIHKNWSDRTRKWYRSLKTQPTRLRAWNIVGTLITFHFVVLGWVWFALPDVNIAIRMFARMFGLNGT